MVADLGRSQSQATAVVEAPPESSPEVVGNGPSAAEHLSVAVAGMAGRLASLLDRQLDAEQKQRVGVDFLQAAAATVSQPAHAVQSHEISAPTESWSEGLSVRDATRIAEHGYQPLDRLQMGLGLSPAELDLVVLAGMAEEHEGYADVLRALHPRAEPWPTVGLAAQLLCRDANERWVLRRLLMEGPAVRSGALRLPGEGPFFERSLRAMEALWPGLAEVDILPEGLLQDPRPAVLLGLDGWLAEEACRNAVTALQAARPVTLWVHCEEEELAAERACSLVAAAGVEALPVRLTGEPDLQQLAQLRVHALLRGAVPILQLHSESTDANQGPLSLQSFQDFPGPLVVSGACVLAEGSRPLLGVEARVLSPGERRQVWQVLLPDLAHRAEELAGRFPLEPNAALLATQDLNLARELRYGSGLETIAGEDSASEDSASETSVDEGSAGTDRGAANSSAANSDAADSDTAVGDAERDLQALGHSLRLRLGLREHRSGVSCTRPQAGWSDLVLPDSAMAQLQDAVARLLSQARVLDDWGFLNGRAGARGVRLLFAGPPGTGKSLAAEVMASAVGVDLLRVDLSRVVSKWIGETEKNLARVFQAAERARAVLLFDEADSLFARRTDVGDAQDRYANLETSYLLTRLERFAGLAVLTTNLRRNLDSAFLRRLDYIVDFDEPDRESRLRLWQCHLPANAPLGPSVDLRQLASLYPLSGALIRNAAVAAAFLAAAEQGPIEQQHFLRALKREHDKAGKAFPGYPPGQEPARGKESHG